LIGVADVRAAFGELADLAPLTGDGGQKIVLTAKRGVSDVVLKLIKPGQDATRTQREVEAVLRLRSSSVPTIHDHGTRRVATSDFLYIVEDRIPGETLAARLRRQPKPPLDFILDVGDALLSMSGECEAHQLVHRDLKPANVIVDGTGKVWVIDFGIARLLDLPSVTKTANQFGVFSFGYSAPEQIRNAKAQINARADLFSIGVILFEMVEGVNPYLAGARDPVEILRRMLTLDVPAPTCPGDAKGELGVFIATMAAKFPSRRPQNTAEAREWFAYVRQELGK